jgi:hypothetical protein
VNRPEWVTHESLDVPGPRATRWEWRRCLTWKGLALLAAAIVLPFGWILPVAQLTRAWVATRRQRRA